MSEARMTLPELQEDLKRVNETLDLIAERLEEEGITEEDIVEEVEGEGSLDEVVEELQDRKANLLKDIDEAEKRDKIAEDLKKGKGEVIKSYEERKEDKMSTEVRKSAEYKDAFAEYLKADGKLNKISEEARALLTENVENGTIAVPVSVQETINTAWENDEIMRRISRTFFKGNIKVGYEKSASGAVFHTEGGAAVAPENLEINYVELIPEMAKKVVEVSDEVLANNDAMVDYLYDEIQYQITKLVAGTAVQKAVASDLSANYTLAGATATAADIVSAQGLLSGEATNAAVITTRATAAAIKANALSANFAYDPFDGMDVIYTDAANLNGAAFVVADLSGIQANFPEGDDAKFKFDDFTKADEDLVRIIGRLYVGIDVVAEGKVVVAKAGA